LIATLLALLIVPVTACVSLFRNYRGEDSTGKRQLRWPFWGTVTAVAGFLLSFATLVFAGVFWACVHRRRVDRDEASRGPVAYSFSAADPISFGFAITKHRLVE